MTHCNQNFIFIIGERRKVFFSITPADDIDTAFIITSGTYTLETSAGELIDEGICIIDNHDVICTIQPPEIGSYLLTCSCIVGEEIIKGTANISVKKKRC